MTQKPPWRSLHATGQCSRGSTHDSSDSTRVTGPNRSKSYVGVRSLMKLDPPSPTPTTRYDDQIITAATADRVPQSGSGTPSSHLLKMAGRFSKKAGPPS